MSNAPDALRTAQGVWLVIGAGRGIGLAMAELLLAHGAQVIGTYQHTQPPKSITALPLDITCDHSITQFTEQLHALTPTLSGVINCVGVLHDEDLGLTPEKSLKQLRRDDLLNAVNVNAVGHVMVLKALEPFFKSVPEFVCVSLSAKVGSIDDNRLGGWHSYRASKAMLNMLMRNVAIEFSRKYPASVVAVIHPGLTRTKLSEPFYANSTLKLHETSESSANILNVINGLSQSDSGGFYTYAGEKLPY